MVEEAYAWPLPAALPDARTLLTAALLLLARPDAEFAKMKDFIAEHAIPWPVVFVPKDDFTKYAVTGIPHVAVIDKQGKMHKIKIGYSASSFAPFRAEVEKLLKR